MVHPALFRASPRAASAAGRPSAAGGFAAGATATAARVLRLVSVWAASGYRPERHYMRGGRTAGAKSLVAG